MVPGKLPESCPTVGPRRKHGNGHELVAVRAVNLSTGPFCTEFGANVLVMMTFLGIGVNFWAPRHKHRNGNNDSRRESCEFIINRTILHRILVRTTL